MSLYDEYTETYARRLRRFVVETADKSGVKLDIKTLSDMEYFIQNAKDLLVIAEKYLLVKGK